MLNVGPAATRMVTKQASKTVTRQVPLEPVSTLAREVVSEAPGFVAGLKVKAVGAFHELLRTHPGLNDFVANFTGPFVKRRFNKPALPGAAGPAKLGPEVAAELERLITSRFKPGEGKAIVLILGGGNETVHTAVVSQAGPDGVKIVQALAQYSDQPEDYSGLGGHIRQFIDGRLGNKPLRMIGVEERGLSDYIETFNRNTAVVLELSGDPQKIEAGLAKLRTAIGKPYDPTLLASNRPSEATESAFYCTEAAAQLVAEVLGPEAMPMSQVGGFPVFQVVDYMRASTVHGGPLKVLYNAGDRLDIKGLDPFPKAR